VQPLLKEELELIEKSSVLNDDFENACVYRDLSIELSRNDI
jgi:hypothetical protein